MQCEECYNRVTNTRRANFKPRLGHLLNFRNTQHIWHRIQWSHNKKGRALETKLLSDTEKWQVLSLSSIITCSWYTKWLFHLLTYSWVMGGFPDDTLGMCFKRKQDQLNNVTQAKISVLSVLLSLQSTQMGRFWPPVTRRVRGSIWTVGRINMAHLSKAIWR